MDENTSDDIFSDVDSKAARYRRKAEMWISLLTAFIPIYIVLILTGTIDEAAFLDPKALYYTPGLWDKAGADFWGAFLFETPFVLFRGFFWMLPPVMIVIYFILAAKANRLYENTKRS
jgi:fatty acid desaturase